MAKKAKRSAAKKAQPRKAAGFTSWSVMGKKIHPAVSLVGGVAATPLGGAIAVVGGVIAVASAVALGAHYLKKKK